MNRPEYKILEGYSASDLEDKMNEAAKQGFTPLGDLQVIFVKTGSEHAGFGTGESFNGYTLYIHKMFKP